MAVAPTRLTLAEFLKLREEKPPLEFADGVITQKVSPKGRHSALQRELIKRLDHAAEIHRTAQVFPELRSHFAGASRVPDISVYRRDRIPLDANGLIADDFTEPPDVAIEIVSPEQSVNALVRRCVWYVAHGVQVALLVDPADESVLAFRGDEQPVAWRAEDRVDLREILPELALTVEELFASLRLR
jgi:Uma2 family endonuclease